nr:MFS transporter [Micromonospora sp. DSM 115978]
MDDPSQPAQPPAAARYATAWTFLVSGIALSSWFVRLPSIKADLDLTNGDVGIAGFAIAAGAVLAMQVTGRLTARFGSAPVLRGSALLVPFLLLGPAFAGNLGQLLAGCLAFGVVVGLLDVAMNAHGVAVERVLGRPVMSGLHGAWSIGAITGSGLAGLAAGAGWSPARHFGWLAVVLAVGSVAAARWLLPATTDRRARPGPAAAAPQAGQDVAADRARWRTGLTRTVALLGLMGSICLGAEGAVGGWSTLFLTEQRAVSPAVASLGYLTFSVLMTAGRLVGDRLSRRWAPATMLRTGATVAAGGLALALAVPSAPVTIAALGLCGVGLSVLVPVIFSAVGRESNRYDSSGASAGASVAHFTTIGYLGVLGGPVVVGAVAERFGLTTALALPAVLLVLVVLGARLTTPAPDQTGQDQTRRDQAGPDTSAARPTGRA